MCDYNLFGLTEPRCPECGFRFEWAELLSADRVPHRYLFEHHPESNFKSFWKTAWGGLRPWRFWRELKPVMPSRPGRLTVYAVRAALLLVGAVIGYGLLASISLMVAARQERAAMLAGQPSSWVTMMNGFANPPKLPPVSQSSLDAMYPLPPKPAFFGWLWQLRPDVALVAEVVAVCVLWPWATYLTLMIFRWSMSRAKVKTIHVRRCVTYSFDVGVWVGLVVLIAWPIYGALSPDPLANFIPTGRAPTLAPRMPGTWWGAEVPATVFWWTIGLAVGVIAFSVLRLVIAYRLYLRFHRPGLTVISSQVILLMLLAWYVLAMDTPLASLCRSVIGLRGNGMYSVR